MLRSRIVECDATGIALLEVFLVARAGDVAARTVRRDETRQKLLDAAYSVCAERGVAGSTVESVCSRAGFTRGAFYSNFASLDDLMFEMWREQSAIMIADLDTALEADIDLDTPFEQVVDAFVRAALPEPQWLRINAEFTAICLRDDALSGEMVRREDAILEKFLPIIETAIERRHRRIVGNRNDLGRAIVAIYDGTNVQCLTDPDRDDAERRRTRLFLTVLLGMTTPF